MAGFPNVPIAPGVPPLIRGADAASLALTLLGADTPGLSALLGAPQWGLFLNGAPVVTAQSVVAFGFRKGFSVPSYPIEQGSFENYNKVQRPFDGRLAFSTGGSYADKQALIESVDTAVSSLQLFDIVTPEVIYSSVSALEYSYDRRAMRGLGLLTVDVICKQIRLTAQTAFSTAATSPSSSDASGSPGSVTRGPDLAPPISAPIDPGASPQTNDGTVQPVTPTASQVSQFNNAMPLP